MDMDRLMALAKSAEERQRRTLEKIASEPAYKNATRKHVAKLRPIRKSA